jgi:septum formation protein
LADRRSGLLSDKERSREGRRPAKPAGFLILASASPRRREILERLGVPFEAIAPDVEELTDGDPLEAAQENARRKARAVGGELVVGVDTVVALGERILPKPHDAAQAREWLRALSGHTHRVVGGLCVVRAGREQVVVEITEVTFRELAEGDLAWYVASGEWEGKAGGYAVQGRGAALVERIAGDYLNVVGLPLAALMRLVPELLQMRGFRA